MAEIQFGTPNTPPPTSGGPARPRKVRILPMLLGFLFWPIFIVAFGGAPACMGFEAPTLAAIEACPPAAAALGTPVTRSWLGFSCGNAESGDGNGNASWTFPVAGPRGSGSVEVMAIERAGTWTLQQATLETDQGTFDVLSCTTGGPIAIAPQTVSATVASTMGAAPVVQGDACSIAVTPVDDGSPFNCRIVVSCGGTTLYGAGTTGYARCTTDAERAVVARDGDPTPSGGDPTLDLRLGSGEAILTDETPQGTWVVSLRAQR